MSESYIDVATTVDAQAIMLWLSSSFKQKVEDYADYDHLHRALIKIISQPQHGQFLLINMNKTISGIVSLLYLSSSAISDKLTMLKDLIIHPAHKDDGHVNNLLTVVTGFAKQHGCPHLILLTDKHNRRADVISATKL